MERIRLVGDLETTRLGYGCSALMARTSRQESLQLLQTAYETGIRHFDVARSYGYGEAERVLGDFVADRRDAVTLTTKLGLTPPAGTAGLRAAKALARRVVRNAPGLAGVFRAGAGAMVRPGRFGVAETRASLDTSLAELRTDHVDLLLLHECTPADLSDDLLGFLEQALRDGKARAIGLATGRQAAAAIARERPQVAAVVQIPDSIGHAAPGALFGDGPGLVTHSALRDGRATLERHLADPQRAADWSRRLDADLDDPDVIPRLLLALALRRNPGGIVLVSSRNGAHLRANAEVLVAPPASAQLDALDALVALELGPTSARTAPPAA